MDILQSAFVQNVCSDKNIKRALRTRKLKTEKPEEEEIITEVYLPYAKVSTDQMGKALKKHQN